MGEKKEIEFHIQVKILGGFYQTADIENFCRKI